MIGTQNPSLLGFCTWNLESKAQNPESKTVLDSLTGDEKFLLDHLQVYLFYVIEECLFVLAPVFW